MILTLTWLPKRLTNEIKEVFFFYNLLIFVAELVVSVADATEKCRGIFCMFKKFN